MGGVVGVISKRGWKALSTKNKVCGINKIQNNSNNNKNNNNQSVVKVAKQYKSG